MWDVEFLFQRWYVVIKLSCVLKDSVLGSLQQNRYESSFRCQSLFFIFIAVVVEKSSVSCSTISPLGCAVLVVICMASK